MTAPVFVDTNVLVYAVDASAGERHREARAWMHMIWQREVGRLSVQVLQEFYAVVTKKLRPGLSRSDAQREVRALTAWQPVAIDHAILERAWFVEERYGLSWWDALIVGSAQASGCSTLLTEDLQHGQRFDSLTVVSPFRLAPSELA